MKNYSSMLESILVWNDYWNKQANPNIQWVDKQHLPLSNEEIDKKHMGFGQGSNAYIAVCRKILRKYPTKESMLEALNNLAGNVKDERSMKKINSIIASLNKTNENDYYKWVFRNLSGDNYPWVRRILTFATGLGSTVFFHNTINDDAVVDTGIGIGDDNFAVGVTPALLGLGGTSVLSDLRHNYRVKSLYNKTPHDILKWNVKIKES